MAQIRCGAPVNHCAKLTFYSIINIGFTQPRWHFQKKWIMENFHNCFLVLLAKQKFNDAACCLNNTLLTLVHYASARIVTQY